MLAKITKMTPLYMIFCLVSTISAYYGEVRETLFNGKWTDQLTRKQCWEKGGHVANRFRDDALNKDRQSAVKMLKNGNDVEVFNFGFYFTPKSRSNYQVDGAIQTALNTKEVFLNIGPKSDKWSITQESKVICVHVEDYKCMKSVVIESQADFDSFRRMKCTDLHSDLVIKSFVNGKSLAALGRIKNIGGRLIIDGMQSNDTVDFTNLETIGTHIFHGNSPALQITMNRFNSVRFPKLQNIACRQNQKWNCIVIGENWSLAKSTILANVEFGTTQVPYKFRKDEERTTTMSHTNYKGGNIKDEKMMIDRNIGYTTYKWKEMFMPGNSVMHLCFGIASLVIFGLIVLCSRFNRKENLDFDMDGIDNTCVKEEKSPMSEVSSINHI